MDVHAALAHLGVRVPDVLLPTGDLYRWAVVACDQFTSQPDYWRQVDQIAGEEPSTLRLIFPEVYLDQPDSEARIAAINASMTDYLDAGQLREHPGTMVLVRRETHHGTVRWGLIVALDLEQYSWAPDAHTLIRATEGTILDRLPPRVRVRESAPLELPHIMVLISDAQRSVIEPLATRAKDFEQLYDTELMLGGGRVTGWAVNGSSNFAGIATSLQHLLDGLDPANPLLFAMGDGNHSFATAKSIWENIKAQVPRDSWTDHPARYCLVELENIYDPGLAFEPIHRVLFGIDRATFEAALVNHCAAFERAPAASISEVLEAIEGPVQSFGLIDASGPTVYSLSAPAASIAAGTLQRTIDQLTESGTASVDYIHGADVTEELGSAPGNLGLLLPQVSKQSFFASIVADGALPRKTFSLGEAQDKRYYLEARRIH
ncbi:DUF1015 domain-containing protein [Micropruina sp.]|uniref:DUF1015 domain-containing protein n=1 Tax=Micropruina sp. TaxID=2737536 RepID=UPI0039E2EC3F